jgi:hypothetical protein
VYSWTPMVLSESAAFNDIAAGATAEVLRKVRREQLIMA